MTLSTTTSTTTAEPKAGKSPLLVPNLRQALDLNVDMGQHQHDAFWQSEASNDLLNLVSSVNLPCFVHDGNPLAVATLARRAKASFCGIGAHVAYPTPDSLGYERGETTTDALKHWLWVQLGALQAVLKADNYAIEHIRPHGRLYQDVAQDETIAVAFIEAVQAFDPWLPILLPPTPLVESLAKRYSVVIASELTLGKRYNRQLQLEASYREQGKWLSPSAMVEQARQWIANQELATSEGGKLPLKLQSIHLSVEQPELLPICTKIVEWVEQAIPINLAKVHGSGWMQGFNDHQIEPALPLYEDY